MIAFFALSSLSVLSNDDDEDSAYMHGISSSSDSISIGTSTGTIIIIEYNTNRKEFYERQKMATATCPITALAENKSYLASSNGDGDIFMFDATELYRPLGQFKGTGSATTCLCLNGNIVIAGYMTGHIRMFRADVAELAMEVTAHIRMITGMDVHPNGNLFVTCSEDQYVQVWTLPMRLTSTAATDPIFTRKLENKLCTGVSFLSDGRICVASYDDSELNIFVETK